jgi:hypothetical protein
MNAVRPVVVVSCVHRGGERPPAQHVVRAVRHGLISPGSSADPDGAAAPHDSRVRVHPGPFSWVERGDPSLWLRGPADSILGASPKVTGPICEC